MRPPASRATSPSTATAMGVSLAALAGLPPSPLFLSELLIVLGGIAAGDVVVSAIVVVALALGFLGLLHALDRRASSARSPSDGDAGPRATSAQRSR